MQTTSIKVTQLQCLLLLELLKDYCDNDHQTASTSHISIAQSLRQAFKKLLVKDALSTLKESTLHDANLDHIDVIDEAMDEFVARNHIDTNLLTDPISEIMSDYFDDFKQIKLDEYSDDQVKQSIAELSSNINSLRENLL